MKIQVGDKVRYLNDVGGGIVRRIMSNTMVEITDESGFDIPVLLHELVVVESFSEKSVEAPQESVSAMPLKEDVVELEGNDIPKFYFAFVKSRKSVNAFDFYVINDCNYHASFVLSFELEHLLHMQEVGILDANTKVFISQIPYEKLPNIQKIHMEVLLFKQTPYEKMLPVEIHHQLQQVKFYKPGVFVVNDFFDEDAYVIEVHNAHGSSQQQFEESFDIEQVIRQKTEGEKKLLSAEPIAKHEVQLEKEVDLHIHELVDNEAGLEASAKLQIQLQAFEKELTKGLQSKLEKIIFIHGVGNGVLKTKIRGILDRDFPNLLYQDASFQKYKFGATLVYLKRFRK